jgi:Protein of unknown function (DUF1643)
VGLIPSTADEQQDDATVRKCIVIAAHNGHTELVMLNMFSQWPTSNHRHAAIDRLLANAVGPENDKHIAKQAAEVRHAGGRIVAAWGNDGWSRHHEVLSLLGGDVRCFGTTRWFERKEQGHAKPRHGWTDDRFPRHASLRGIPPEAVETEIYPWPRES